MDSKLQSVSFPSQENFLKRDQTLNRLVVDNVTLAAVGLLGGVASSLFFKNKCFIASMGVGLGLGYSVAYNQRFLINKQ